MVVEIDSEACINCFNYGKFDCSPPKQKPKCKYYTKKDEVFRKYYRDLKRDIEIPMSQFKNSKNAEFINCFCRVAFNCPNCNSQDIIHLVDSRIDFHYWYCNECRIGFEAKFVKSNEYLKCRCQIKRYCPKCESTNIRHRIKLDHKTKEIQHGWICLKCNNVFL